MSQLYFDGGASPNPGRMHVCIMLDQEPSFQWLDNGTNNEAEWLALCWGISVAHEKGITDLEIIGDSQLVINQANGLWKIKKPEFLPLKKEFDKLRKSFTNLSLRYEPREKNLAGHCIENHLKARTAAPEKSNVVQPSVAPKPISTKTGKQLSDEQATCITRLREFVNSDEQVFSVHGLAGTGKAQPITCKVLTPDGWRNIGSLQTGDMITASDGTPTQIFGVYDQGEQDVYELTFHDGRKTRCTSEHLWRIWTGQQWRILSLADLLVHRHRKKRLERFAVPLYTPTLDKKDIELPLDPYFLGVLIGDGGLTCGTDWCISGKKPLDAIRSLNLDVKSHEKFIPEIYKNSSINQRISILQGLMDTDGTVDKSGSTSFATTSKRLAQDVQFLIWSLGGLAMISTKTPTFTYKDKKKKGKLWYNVNIRTTSQQSLFRSPRKKNSLPIKNQYSENLRLRLTNIELIGREQCRCIAITHPNRLYVTDDFIVTHNTTVLVEFAAEQEMILAAYTGKAASVLRDKSGMDASTIHGVIYLPIIDPETGEMTGFRLVPQNLTGHIIGVDESSMVNTQIAKDLLKTGAKIVTFGDPGQLPPVEGDPYFCDPDYIFQEIHRQAKESPIIRQAHSVKNDRGYTNDTELFKVVRLASDDILINSDIVLCHTNKTRDAINRKLRSFKNLKEYPKAGETLVCLKNAHNYGLCNGAVYTLKRDFNPTTRGKIALDVNGATLEVPGVAFAKTGEQIKDIAKRCGPNIVSAFDFGYCLTVHKAQGSEWRNVTVIDEHWHPDGRNKWLYTAITRASERVTVIRQV